jgi:TRAP-type C4-dicarboxylate transport system, periplasmic component
MKKNVKRVFCLVLALAMTAALAACGGESNGASTSTSAGGAEGEASSIKISTVLTEASVSGQALQKFADDLSTKTDGRITCEVYYNGVLGTTDAVEDMMYEGDVQIMTMNPVSYETQVVELATLDQYYMFDDLAHAHRFLEGEGGKYLNNAYNKIGMQGLATFGLGFRELSNNKKEIKTIDDMKGMTLRGYSPIQIAAWQSIGTTPTSVDWNELFVSMQQGLLDGQEAALSTINDFSFYEVQKYITLTDHVFTCDMVLASQEWLEGLSAEDRAIIEETMNEAYEWQKETYQAGLATLQDKFVKEYGMTITKLDDSVKAEMAEKMSAASKAEIIKVCGQEIYDTVQGYVEAAR